MMHQQINFDFKDELKIGGQNPHHVHVDFHAPTIFTTRTKSELMAHMPYMYDMAKRKCQAMATNQVALLGSTTDEVIQVISQNGALCVSFGITNYDSIVWEYRDCCEIRTFVSNDEVWLFIMKKNILNCIVNHICDIYNMRMGHPLEKLYIRASSQIGCKITNVPPTQFRERYLEMDLDSVAKQDDISMLMTTKLLTNLTPQQEDELANRIADLNQTYGSAELSASVVIEDKAKKAQSASGQLD